MGVKNMAVMIKTLNLVTGIGLVAISILAIIDITNMLTFKVFLIPCPFFVGFFGICIIGAQMKVKAILNRLSFLKSLAGRGLFNVFLSSTCFYFLSRSDLLSWASGLTLFITGVVYIALHFGYGKELKAELDAEDEGVQKEKSREATGREGLI